MDEGVSFQIAGKHSGSGDGAEIDVLNEHLGETDLTERDQKVDAKAIIRQMQGRHGEARVEATSRYLVAVVVVVVVIVETAGKQWVGRDSLQ